MKFLNVCARGITKIEQVRISEEGRAGGEFWSFCDFKIIECPLTIFQSIMLNYNEPTEFVHILFTFV